MQIVTQWLWLDGREDSTSWEYDHRLYWTALSLSQNLLCLGDLCSNLKV